jgi:hypothetical protein
VLNHELWEMIQIDLKTIYNKVQDQNKVTNIDKNLTKLTFVIQWKNIIEMEILLNISKGDFSLNV